MRSLFALIVPLLAGFEGARLVSGGAPSALPPHAVTGATVVLELKVSRDGEAAAITTLSDGPPFTDALREAVSRWRFEPASEAGAPVAAPVLVAGVLRPPDLVGGPPPSAPPLPPRPSCDELPVPVEVVTPLYPALGIGDHTVLAEAWVEKDGRVAETLKVLEGGGAFAAAASEAARRWRFRGACRAGMPLPARAYLVFGFRAPVVRPPIRR